MSKAENDTEKGKPNPKPHPRCGTATGMLSKDVKWCRYEPKRKILSFYTANRKNRLRLARQRATHAHRERNGTTKRLALPLLTARLCRSGRLVRDAGVPSRKLHTKEEKCAAKMRADGAYVNFATV